MMQAVLVNTPEQQAAIRQIRNEVFVQEQGVPAENEFDHYDVSGAEHVIVYYEGTPVGTGRIRVVDGSIAKMERICVLAAYRKYGVGVKIMEALEQLARDKGLKKAKLHAQTQAEGFYRRVGYEMFGEPFEEENIPHIAMMKAL